MASTEKNKLKICSIKEEMSQIYFLWSYLKCLPMKLLLQFSEQNFIDFYKKLPDSGTLCRDFITEAVP